MEQGGYGWLCRRGKVYFDAAVQTPVMARHPTLDGAPHSGDTAKRSGSSANPSANDNSQRPSLPPVLRGGCYRRHGRKQKTKTKKLNYICAAFYQTTKPHMTGEIIAIGVAFSWTLSALFFEYGSRRIGSLNLNLIRLVFGSLFLGITLWAMSGHFLPAHADTVTWLWMSASGLVGFVLGDYFLFASYTLIPARFSQLFMTLAPPFSAVFGYLMLGEKMTWLALAGMCVTLGGIALSVLKKDTEAVHGMRLSLPVKGVVFAIIGSFGQGLGIVLSKEGMLAYENVYQPENTLYISFAATQMRAIIGIAGFSVIILLRHGTTDFIHSFKNIKGIRATFAGSIFGPFLGVALSLMAVQHTNTAIASTIMATVPIVILAPEYFLLKRKVTAAQVAGALLSVGGVALFFL